jgi:hypothetical protein
MFTADIYGQTFRYDYHVCRSDIKLSATIWFNGTREFIADKTTLGVQIDSIGNQSCGGELVTKETMTYAIQEMI